MKGNDLNRPPPVVFKYVVNYADERRTRCRSKSRWVSPLNCRSLANLKNAVVAWTGTAATPQSQRLVVYQLSGPTRGPRPRSRASRSNATRKGARTGAGPVRIGLTVGSLK